MTTIHLVIVGASATETATGQTPEPSDIVIAYELAQTRDVTLHVHLIDPDYSQALLAKPRSAFQEDARRLAGYDKKVVDVFPGRYDQWLKLKQKENALFQPTDRVIYYIQPSKRPERKTRVVPRNNIYELMDTVEEQNVDNRWYVLAPAYLEAKQLSVEAVVTTWLDREMPVAGTEAKTSALLRGVFNFYNGDELKGAYPVVDLVAMKYYTMAACALLQHYIAAGYHSPDQMKAYSNTTRGGVPSWIFNVEVPPIKGFISYYGLFPEVADMEPSIEIRESSDYRRILTSHIARAMGNFVINNKLLGSDQIAGLGGWYSQRVWAAVEDAIYAWDVRQFAREESLQLVAGAIPLQKRREPEAAAEAAPTGPLAPIAIVGAGGGGIPFPKEPMAAPFELASLPALPLPEDAPAGGLLPLPGGSSGLAELPPLPVLY
ncbi:Hypothetical protein POVN_LOCUS320 [uncultured virus]|nr:Hypothetical protein POVN_LOCUS320 [uncultured virus]